MVETLLRDLDPRWTAPTRGPDPAAIARRHRCRSDRSAELRRPLPAKSNRSCDGSSSRSDGARRRPMASLAFWPRPTRVPSMSVSRLLVLRSTEATREIARRYETTLATAFPAVSRDVVLALTTSSAPWPGSGIVWMNLHGRSATLDGLSHRGESPRVDETVAVVWQATKPGWHWPRRSMATPSRVSRLPIRRLTRDELRTTGIGLDMRQARFVACQATRGGTRRAAPRRPQARPSRRRPRSAPAWHATCRGPRGPGRPARRRRAAGRAGGRPRTRGRRTARPGCRGSAPAMSR